MQGVRARKSTFPDSAMIPVYLTTPPRRGLSVLETAWLTFSLPAWHKNIRKQVIKAPKLHFIDTGLVCFLLGIHSAEELRHHPLRGAIFESWVVSEILKDFSHQGRTPTLYHYREPRGLEIDFIIESAKDLHLQPCIRCIEASKVKLFSTVGWHKRSAIHQRSWAGV